MFTLYTNYIHIILYKCGLNWIAQRKKEKKIQYFKIQTLCLFPSIKYFVEQTETLKNLNKLPQGTSADITKKYEVAYS